METHQKWCEKSWRNPWSHAGFTPADMDRASSPNKKSEKRYKGMCDRKKKWRGIVDSKQREIEMPSSCPSPKLREQKRSLPKTDGIQDSEEK